MSNNAPGQKILAITRLVGCQLNCRNRAAAKEGAILVRLQKGQRWKCEYRYCGCEIEILASSEVECGINPRCSCGGVMKKIYLTPEVKPGEALAAETTVRRKAASGGK